jgi:hypothetical protein
LRGAAEFFGGQRFHQRQDGAKPEKAKGKMEERLRLQTARNIRFASHIRLVQNTGCWYENHGWALGLSAMKHLLALFLASAVEARGGDSVGSAVEYHFAKSYLVIATTDLRAILELRSYDHDHIIDSVVLLSRYMPPDFEAKDLSFEGDTWQFILRTREGGTGFAETHFAIYAVLGERVRKLGDFVVDREAESWPEPTYKERLSGKVSFPSKSELRYRYTQVITRNGKTTTTSVSKSFSLNPKTMKYEETKKPLTRLPERTAGGGFCSISVSTR